MRDFMRFKLIDTAMKVVERSNKDEYEQLLDKINDVKSINCVNEVYRMEELTNVLLESETFMRALLVISLSDSWEYCKSTK